MADFGVISETRLEDQITRGVGFELRERVKGCGVNIKIINFSEISLNSGKKIATEKMFCL